MSILIKGMEMPQGNSTVNVLIYADGTVYTGHVNDSRYSAVSVPTPHGRLIDADALIAKTRKLYCNNCILRTGTKNGKKQFVYEIGAAPCRGCWIDDMVTELQDAPTIIEAERSKT